MLPGMEGRGRGTCKDGDDERDACHDDGDDEDDGRSPCNG
jgi:hypothetical protein